MDSIISAIESEQVKTNWDLLGQTIVGIAMIAGGVAALLGIWIPGIRGHWKGEKFGNGRVTSAGSGLLFMCIGFLFLFGDTISKPLRSGVAVCVLAALVLIVCGYLLDSHAYDSAQRAYQLPGETRTGSLRRRTRWLLAGFILLLLTTMLLSIVRHAWPNLAW